MSLAVGATPQVNHGAAMQPQSNWKIALKIVAQLALQILIPFAAALLSYFLLPASALTIGVPTITICTAFIVAFLSVGEGIFPFAKIETPLPANAPRGMVNGVMNCWANSLAQTLLSDNKLIDWFSDFPDEWERIERLPFLPDAFFPINEVQVAYRDSAPFDNYLQLMHPPLSAFVEEQNSGTRNYAKSYYRKYCGNFQGTDEEFDELLLDPQFIENLYTEDQQKIKTYFQILAEAPEASSYFAFFAEIPEEERLACKDALVAFQLFVRSYDEAQEANLPQLEFRSQELRVALSNLNPLIDPNPMVQLDPMEGLTAILQFLTPRDLKVDVVGFKEYAQGPNPAIQGGARIQTRETNQSGYMQLTVTGSYPNLQDMVKQVADQRNENPELLVTQRAVDGIDYPYLVEREGRQFVEAPPTLWLHIKRMANIEHSGWECLQRLMSNWFSCAPVGLKKLTTPITAQPQITIELQNGEEKQYQLNAVMVHEGPNLQIGHYISYRRVETEPGNWVWFEMNDARVRQLSDEEAARLAEQGYAYLYSVV